MNLPRVRELKRLAIRKSEFAAHAATVEELRRRAQERLDAFWERLDTSDPEAAKEAIMEFVPALAEQYHDAAATLAADFYETQRFRETGDPFEAITPEMELGKVEGSLRYAVGFLFGGE